MKALSVAVSLFFGGLAFGSPAGGLKPSIFKFAGNISAKVDQNSEDGADQIAFFKKGVKSGCGFKEQPARSFFHSITEVKVAAYDRPLYISDWSLGVHGQKFTVFDPSLGKKCVLKQVESGYPMTYAVVGDHVIFKKGDSGEQTWKPGEEITALPAGSPSAPRNP